MSMITIYYVMCVCMHASVHACVRARRLRVRFARSGLGLVRVYVFVRDVSLQSLKQCCAPARWLHNRRARACARARLSSVFINSNSYSSRAAAAAAATAAAA